MQRCRTWDNWPAAKACFLEELHAIIFSQGSAIVEDDEESIQSSDEGKDSNRQTHPTVKPKTKRAAHKSEQEMQLQWDFVERYFCDNWFTEIWIGTCVHFYDLQMTDMVSSRIYRHWPPCWTDTGWNMECKQLDRACIPGI